MLSSKNEKVFEKLGYLMATSGSPLGFLNSKGFNPNFKVSEVKNLQTLLDKMHEQALSKIGKELGSTSRAEDILTTLYLLSQTYCYVVTSPKSDDITKFTSSKVTVRFGTLDKKHLDIYLGGGESAEWTTRNTNAYKKMLGEMGKRAKEGVIAFPELPYNKGRAIKFGRTFANFYQDEYMVLPASVVYGYVTGLREKMMATLGVINARKTEGAMREFLLTTDMDAVKTIYDDPEMLDLFSGLRSLPANIFTEDEKSPVTLVVGLHNLNTTYYELGIPKEEYPKRQLNLCRLQSINWVSEEEEKSKVLRTYQRYAEIDVDDVVATVTRVVTGWSLEEMNQFMHDTLGILKSNVGAIAETDIEIKGVLDFQIKFAGAVAHYSTSYVRAVVDYLLLNPDKFDGYTGRKMSVKNVVSTVVSGGEEEQKGILDLSADDLDFGF